MTASHRSRGLLAFLGYLGFVVYGSLVPLNFLDIGFDEGVRRFSQIAWLDLDAGSRADWVSNLVLYVPLAFLGCTWLGRARSAMFRHARALIVLLLCLAVALAVEFTQTWFGPRTVSLNDLLAETLGTLIGIAIWSTRHDAIERLWQDFLAGGRRSLAAMALVFGLAYLALSLFPYDFALSADELATTLASSKHGLLLGNSEESVLRIMARLLGETLAIAPLGLLFGLLARRVDLRRAFAAGALLGLALELIQLLLISGVSQGASLLTRGLGLAGGALLGQQLHRHGLLPLARLVHRLRLPALALYLPALAALSGWLNPQLVDAATFGMRLADVQWLPFWYHYYTSETIALTSLLANLTLYAPLGVLAWASHTVVPRRRQRGLFEPALWAALLALLVEASKLWLANVDHPDPTNLLIAAVGAAITYRLAMWLTLASSEPEPSGPTTEATSSPPADHTPSAAPTVALRHPPLWAAGVSITALALGLSGLWAHPLPLVAVLALAYLLVLWRWPWAWLAVLPALLPVLDLAPLGGRLLFDEFDLLILFSIAIGYWRIPAAHRFNTPRPLHLVAFGLLLLSALIASSTGLASFIQQPGISVDYSHSPLDALLVGKGVLLALALLPLLLWVPRSAAPQIRHQLTRGLAAGLVLLTALVVYERQLFVGLSDFSNVFRVTGGFSSMFSGGAYIEAYIALAFPSLIVLTLQQRSLVWRALGMLAAAAAAYAMMVTFSRVGYAGLAVAVLLTLLLGWRRNLGGPRWLAPALVGAMLLAAVPVFLGDFAQQRLSHAGSDLQVRLAHWDKAVAMMDHGTTPAGMGFGQYPTQYLWQADPASPPGAFGVEHSEGAPFLRLAGGEPYYLDQRVDIDRSQPHQLMARLRFADGARALNVSLCEKALLYSFRCSSASLQPPPRDAGDWLVLQARIDPLPGEAGQWPQRPLKLSISGPSQGSIDIQRIDISADGQTGLLRNPDFSGGLQYWMPAIDFDPPWHIHQTLVEVFYAQGLLGLGALALVLAAFARSLARPLRQGDFDAIAWSAGVLGLMTVGLLGSTLDTARVLFAFYLLSLGGTLLLGTHRPEKPSH